MVRAALVGSSLLLVGACTSYALSSSARLHAAATEDLCAQRNAPIGGARIRAELRLRGADCSAFEAALAGQRRFDLALPFQPSYPPPAQRAMPYTPPGSLPPPVPFAGAGGLPPPPGQFGSFAPPPWFAGADGEERAYAGRAAPTEPGWSGGGFAAVPATPAWRDPVPSSPATPAWRDPPVWRDPAPSSPEPEDREGGGSAATPSPLPFGRAPSSDAPRGAVASVAPAPPPPSSDAGRSSGGAAVSAAAAGRGALAPLIAPGCVERAIEPLDRTGQAQRATVTFRNNCGVPIRVRFAARPGVALTEVTPLLRPGESSTPVPLAEGFAHPGFIVCSYERVPERALCQ
ncbi:MAG: hypothetical protein IRZ13_18330 [Acetobacteraceae bacterium]|nr:hypothetical protein [Acetobacteraceae bacterium]